MSLKRKRQTSALRTYYIHNNTVRHVRLIDETIKSWAINNLNGTGTTLVIINDLPRYDKLMSQRIINPKKNKPNFKPCKCTTCRLSDY